MNCNGAAFLPTPTPTRRYPCAADPELFFDPEREAEAVAVCEGCPIIDQCRRVARSGREVYGVWGGEGPIARWVWLYNHAPAGSRERKEAFAVLTMLGAERGVTGAIELARATGLPIVDVARRHGAIGRRPDVERNSVIIGLWQDGMRPIEVARILGLTRDTVVGVLKRHQAAEAKRQRAA